MEKIIDIVKEAFTPPVQETWNEVSTHEQRQRLIARRSMSLLNRLDSEEL